MDIPVELLVGEHVALAGAIAAVWRVMVTDRIKSLETERDDYKNSWKDSVQSHRRTRRQVEADEMGAPSVAPPPPTEEKTGRYVIDDRADRAWSEQRERERAQRREDEMLRRYNSGESISTPPEGFRKPPRLR